MSLNHTRPVALLALFVLLLASSGCAALRDARGYRYCEILLVYDGTSEVWGTQGLNRCPAEAWAALDPEALRTAHDADGIIMNGPRYFVINGASGVAMPEGDTRIFGTIEMRKLATLSAEEPDPYAPSTVLRTNVWEFKSGNEIYELTDPDGRVYVMQSFSQIIDPTLQEDELAALATRLDLPSGWQFSARVLDEDLDLVADGEAVVVVDDLRNTYQRR
ncbi:MAG: hypothetical protein AAFV01_01025 [Bacteroidota bacterium]